MLKVKEIYGPTINGEGFFSGWPAIFIKFEGCNMWNGNLKERLGSQCPFCEADFAKGQGIAPEAIVNHVRDIAKDREYLVVLSGGEPLLQKEGLLIELCILLKDFNFKIQIETNGSLDSKALNYIDYVVCSPKVAFSKLIINKQLVGCWKLLYPHHEISIEPFIRFSKDNSEAQYYLQPVTAYQEETYDRDPAATVTNIVFASNKIMELGLPWKLSLQIQKIIGAK